MEKEPFERIFHCYVSTPRKINMEPENTPLEKELERAEIRGRADADAAECRSAVWILYDGESGINARKQSASLPYSGRRCRTGPGPPCNKMHRGLDKRPLSEADCQGKISQERGHGPGRRSPHAIQGGCVVPRATRRVCFSLLFWMGGFSEPEKTLGSETCPGPQ